LYLGGKGIDVGEDERGQFPLFCTRLNGTAFAVGSMRVFKNRRKNDHYKFWIRLSRCVYHLFNWRVFKNRSSLWHLTMYSNVYPKLMTINKYVMYITLKSQDSLERWIKNACKATKGYSHDVKRYSRRINRTSLPEANVFEK